MNKHVLESLEEGVATNIRNYWVDPEEIDDLKLKMAYKAASSAYDAFLFASALAEVELERIINDNQR